MLTKEKIKTTSVEDLEIENCIDVDSDKGKQLGFTSDKFQGYLFTSAGSIYISMIISLDPLKGNVKKLFDRIVELGYTVKVPNPMGRMFKIVSAPGSGFVLTREISDMFGLVDVWEYRGK